MTIQHIGTRAMSLYITEGELKALNLALADIGPREARWLLNRALAEAQLKDWAAAEITLYPGVDSVLLFARRRAAAPCHFFFSDFETLITVSHLCPEALPSSLGRVQGGYVLTVYPFEGESPPTVLHEFSKELGRAPYFAVHQGEQGGELLSVSALAYLRAHFTPRERW